MNRIILGNIISFVGACLMVGAGLLKKRRTILVVQCVQFGIMGSANFILGGITGGLSALVSIARNVVCAQKKMTFSVKLLFTFLLIILCIGSNTAGLLGILPILSACLYTWLLDIEGERNLKLVIIIAQSFWVIYDVALMNYVSFAFDILTIIANLVGIVTLKKHAKKPL